MPFRRSPRLHIPVRPNKPKNRMGGLQLRFRYAHSEILFAGNLTPFVLPTAYRWRFLHADRVVNALLAIEVLGTFESATRQRSLQGLDAEALEKTQLFARKGLDALSKDRPRVLAIIQAQNGSGLGPQRPGHLVEPALKAALDALARSKSVTDLAFVTTQAVCDDPIVTVANTNSVIVLRTPEDDMLAGFARCAETLGADVIVRLTSMAVDPERIDHLVSSLVAQRGDYVLDDADTSHRSVDVFSRRALDRLMMDARTDPLARRQVTGYLKAFPHFVRTVRASPMRETPRAIERAQVAHERLDAMDGEGSLGDLIGLLASEAPSVSVRTRGATAVIRCGDDEFGPARVKRSIAIARALRDGHGITTTLVVGGARETLDLARRSGFEIVKAAARDEANQLASLVSQNKASIIALDCQDGPSLPELTRLKRDVTLLAVTEEFSSRRRIADVAYFAPLPSAERLDWKGARTLVRVGWQWVVTSNSPARSLPQTQMPRPTVLVAFGKTETARLTLLAAGALATLPPVFRSRFAIPSRLTDRNRLARAIITLKPGFETIEGIDDLSIEFASADVAITDFGPIAYDLAAAGLPALYLMLDEDGAQSAAAFEHAGMGISLGLAKDATAESVALATQRLLSDRQRRRDMRAAALMTIDHNGAGRIAADLASLLEERLEPAQATSA